MNCLFGNHECIRSGHPPFFADRPPTNCRHARLSSLPFAPASRVSWTLGTWAPRTCRTKRQNGFICDSGDGVLLGRKCRARVAGVRLDTFNCPSWPRLMVRCRANHAAGHRVGLARAWPNSASGFRCTLGCDETILARLGGRTRDVPSWPTPAGSSPSLRRAACCLSPDPQVQAVTGSPQSQSGRSVSTVPVPPDERSPASAESELGPSGSNSADSQGDSRA
jgi:hypothetical protein